MALSNEQAVRLLGRFSLSDTHTHIHINVLFDAIKDIDDASVRHGHMGATHTHVMNT